MASIRGVLRSKVGYCGGSTLSPTYKNIGDHTETVQLQFDPVLVSYDSLCDQFFKSDNPNKTRLLRQYASIIFPHSDEQFATAVQAKLRFEKAQKFKCTTELLMEPTSAFTDAENYHQKYLLQMNEDIMDLLEEYLKLTPDSPDFVFSPIASKLNGLCVNGGSQENVVAEINRLEGLSKELKEKLIECLL